MGQGLRHAPEHRPYAHPRRKYHAEPGRIGKLRDLAVGIEADPAVVAERGTDAEDQKTGGREKVKPAKMRRDERQGLLCAGFEFGRAYKSQTYESDKQDGRALENPAGSFVQAVK